MFIIIHLNTIYFPDGLSSVEFLPDDGSIKFLKDIWVPDITLSGVIRYSSDIYVLSDPV